MIDQSGTALYVLVKEALNRKNTKSFNKQQAANSSVLRRAKAGFPEKPRAAAPDAGAAARKAKLESFAGRPAERAHAAEGRLKDFASRMKGKVRAAGETAGAAGRTVRNFAGTRGGKAAIGAGGLGAAALIAKMRGKKPAPRPGLPMPRPGSGKRIVDAIKAHPGKAGLAAGAGAGLLAMLRGGKEERARR